MKFGLTGATSDIGKALYTLLTLKGYQVTKFGRHEKDFWQFGNKIPNSDIDVLFHLAHDRNLSLVENKEALEIIISSFGEKIVFISSTSAHPQAVSNYGKSKFVAQNLIEKAGGTSLISGIIYGNEVTSDNSIITKLSRVTSSYPFVPLPFSGKSPLYFSEIKALSEALFSASTMHEAGNFRAFSKNHLTLRQLVEKLAAKSENSPKVIDIPDFGFAKILRTSSDFLKYPGLLDSLLSLVNEMEPEYLNELKLFPEIVFPNYS
jgi:nucleoside-diphosphate-sugar epimerase